MTTSPVERLLTDAERARIKGVGGTARQVAGWMGSCLAVFSFLMLVAPDAEPEDPSVLLGILAAFNILAVVLAATNRKQRQAAATIADKGTLVDTVAVPLARDGGTRVLDLGRAQIVPGVEARDKTLAAALGSTDPIQVTLAGPVKQGNALQAFILSLDGKDLPRPVPCTVTVGGKAAQP